MLLGLLSLSGCARSGPVDSFCVVERPILISKGDVLGELELRQIIAHNEKGEKLCGWKAPG